MKENGFKLTKGRSRKYPTDYADDITLLGNTPAQAEILLHSLEQAAAGIGLHVNSHKTEYMRFNQRGDISTLNSSTLKLVDKFNYLGSSVLSTHNRGTDSYQSYESQTWPIKWNVFFQAAVVSILLYRYTTWTLTKRMEKKLDGNYTRMLRAILNKSWRQQPIKQQLYATYHPSWKQSKLDEKDMQDTAGEVGTNS